MKCVLEPPWLVLSVLSQMHVKTAYLMRLDEVMLVISSSTGVQERQSFVRCVYISIHVYY